MQFIHLLDGCPNLLGAGDCFLSLGHFSLDVLDQCFSGLWPIDFDWRVTFSIILQSFCFGSVHGANNPVIMSVS